jgi:UDP-glucose 4-epimerase
LARSSIGGETFLIAVTGASGYVGAHCVAEAMKRGERVVAISTQPAKAALLSKRDQLIWHFVSDYHALNEGDWSQRFAGVKTVIHCAARVHQTSPESAQHMQRDNVVLTDLIARAAVAAGVEQFIFLSSAAVYGDAPTRTAISLNAPLNGRTAYALSKIEAEQKLAECANSLGIGIDIFRPPVVYGVGAPGNLSRLARMVAHGWPLPFGAIHNRRSVVSIRTLVASIFWRIDQSTLDKSTVNVWQPTDREPISTTNMVNAISRGLPRATRNVAVPPLMLQWALKVCGQRRMARQLIDNWTLDPSALSDAGFRAFADTEIELELLGRQLAR